MLPQMCGSCQAPTRTSGLVPGPGIGECLVHHATEAYYKLAIVRPECSELFLVRSGEKYQVAVWFLVDRTNPRTCSGAVLFAVARLCRPFVDGALGL